MVKEYFHKKISRNLALALLLFGCAPEGNQLVYSSSGCVEGNFTVNVKQTNGKIYSELFGNDTVIAATSVGFYLNTEAQRSFSYHGIPMIFKCYLANTNTDTSKRYFAMPLQGQFVLTQELYCGDKKIGYWKRVI